MPQQLLLEGPNLESLILRARQEYGPDARIVRAEKVRRGGFLGFFSKEHFEIAVEVADTEPVAHPRPTSLSAADAALAEEIADAFAAREAMLAETLGTQPRQTAQPPTAAAVPPPFAEAGVSAPAESASRAPESTDMAEFDRLVLQLTEGQVVQPALATFTPLALGSAATKQTGAAGAGASGIGASGYRNDGEQGATRDDAASARPAAAAAKPWLPMAPAERQEPRQRPRREPGGVIGRWGVFTDVAGAVATECTVPMLLSLGVPLRHLEDFTELDRPVPLLEVVAKFQIPPVRRPEPGDLIVVAGPADDALAVASQLAAWLSMPATSVVLAGDIAAIRGHGRRIRVEADAAAARRRADKAAALGEPLIIALGVAAGRRGAAAAAPLLAAFDADTVWAVVDAKKRPSAHREQLRLLAGAGRIDALAAVGLAEAQAPAAIVDADLPVAWMDGLPAASVVWAALLGERIALPD